MGRKFEGGILLLGLCLVWAQGPAVKAGEAKGDSAGEKTSIGNPYCGVYCLYGAVRCIGEKIDGPGLIKPEWIGSAKGSSLAELKRAAEHYGFYAVALGNLTSNELRECPWPVILHVKGSSLSKKYDHYWLFIGAEGNDAKLFDPPSRIFKMNFSKLGPHWSGQGLVVSDKPIDLGIIYWLARIRLALYISIVVLVVAGIRVVRRRWRLGRQERGGWRQSLQVSVTQSFVLLLTAAVCAVVWHMGSGSGLLVNEEGIAFVQDAYLEGFIPEVKASSVSGFRQSGAIFVDARYPKDFASGHLEGAINIPVYTSKEKCRELLGVVGSDISVVVYCHREGCGFARTLAAQLIRIGYEDVCVLKESRQGLVKSEAVKDRGT